MQFFFKWFNLIALDITGVEKNAVTKLNRFLMNNFAINVIKLIVLSGSGGNETSPYQTELE